MTTKQLYQIKQFAKSYYQKNDQFHQWEHAILTVKYARMLANQYKNVNIKVLDAACYLHDIGRINKDEGHPEESVRLFNPFLMQIGLKDQEIAEITHAVEIHAKERIHEAKTIEAKLLFDSDKIQILSVYGFIRVTMFVVEKRKMKLDKALEFMWKYVTSVYPKYLQTPLSKKILKPEIKKIEKILIDFKKGTRGQIGNTLN